MALEKVALDGKSVRLEPLEERHREATRPAAQHPEIFTVTTSALRPLFDPYIDNALKRSDCVRELAFAVLVPLRSDFDCLKYCRAQTGVEVGNSARALLSCSYESRASRSLMIMSGPEARVPKDDEGYADGISNRQNHSAELLAKADGHVRDSVYFSIIDTDWPAAKAGLEKRLAG